MTENNPTEYTETPKSVQKDIIVLSDKEKMAIIKAIETGEGKDGDTLKGRYLTSALHNKLRNKAIVTLLAGTGIRISELVGLNIDDIDLSENVAYIIRKGGKEDHVYFSNTVAEALKLYLTEGRPQYDIPADEKALFVSMKFKRLSVRSVEHMIKFYADFAIGRTDKRKVTPHKYRSTFGTEAALKSHDLQLTAALLGHKNVATTSKFYVKYSDNVKKEFIQSLDNDTRENHHK
jgi:site-specific recombinase XerD